MEQLVVHSKSYLVRWISVAPGHSISWSIQPHKKSISFGVFKHSGAASAGLGITANSSAATSPTTTEVSGSPALGPVASNDGKVRRPSASGPANSASLIDKLEKVGMKSVAWMGKCEADKVSMGRYDVVDGEGGMYGLVFDNTHSKTLSKTITFVLITFPTDAPPKTDHLHYSQAVSTVNTPSLSAVGTPALVGPSDSHESLPSEAKAPSMSRRASSRHGAEHVNHQGATFYTGVLSKKRRKRNQGYARRFFSLDFTSCTLSYYKNRQSSALRGAIPLALAAIGTNEKTREISIDSGAEIWLLRAGRNDFEGWRQALERASHSASEALISSSHSDQPTTQLPKQYSAADDRAWDGVESLVGRVAGITDAVRRLAKDTDPKYFAPRPGRSVVSLDSNTSPSPVEASKGDYFGSRAIEGKSPDKTRFWNRKSSSSQRLPSPSDYATRRSVSSQRVPTQSLAIPTPGSGPIQIPKRNSEQATELEGMHDHCLALLRDLDAVVAEFSSLIHENRQRRLASRPVATTRHSYETTRSEEFFDAQDGMRSPTQLLNIHEDSDHEDDSQDREGSEGGDSNSTVDSGDEDAESIRSPRGIPASPHPSRPKTLSPLPHEAIMRRTTIPPSAGSPPSLIGFLRKNVGKDLSTIAMPVTANEPLSLLQRQAEQMEYSELLDAAVNAPVETGEQLLYIAAFAVSPLSNARSKERAIRKPFNPMLGETYELVREDKGFRFLAEKVSHRPVRVACQAEAREWTFTHAPIPTQKFWGKSAELITEGRARVTLHKSEATFSWTPATCFLRNIIAGEKYVEPVQTMTVLDETSGAKAVVTFKSGGMFSGRSEEVLVQCIGANGAALPLGLAGRWTSELHLTGPGSDERVIWKVDTLVPNAATHYGLTSFSATLNEMTALEQHAIPPTDSRLRPDQRAHEAGETEQAEKLKAALEEAQRRRRKEMESRSEGWEPRWFELVRAAGSAGVPPTGVNASGTAGAADDTWRIKAHEGYWDVREAVVGFKGGKWDGVRDVFEV